MKAPKRLPKILTEQEAEALRMAAKQPRDKCAISLMLDLGLRADECVNVRISGIDWSEQVLRFRGKGDRDAELRIPSRLRAVIEHTLRHRPPTATHDHLLWNLRKPSEPITRWGLWRMVVELGLKALGRHTTPHMLRHTCGSQLYKRYGDLGVVQKILRHVKLETTSIYVSISTDQQKEYLESLDSRAWWIRWWESLWAGIPDAFKPKAKPLSIGETIGRASEIEQLRNCLRQQIPCILIGDRGAGRGHLLNQITGKQVYHLERLTPLRECLVELCQLLVQDGHLAEMPKGRSVTPFQRAIMRVGKTGDFTLVLGSLDGLGKREARALEKLSKVWLIFGAVEPNEKAKVEKIFFGRARFLEVGNLSKEESFALARKAIAQAEISLADEGAYLNNLYMQTQGNAGAILALIESTKQTGDLNPTHSGIQRVLSGIPFLSGFFFLLFAARYTASSTGSPEIKIYILILLIFLLPLLGLEKILKEKAK